VLYAGGGGVLNGYCMEKDKTSEITALKELLDNDTLFSDEGQIFSFDALQTQSEILNKIDEQGDRYIAKVKNNQKELRRKVIERIEEYQTPVDRYVFEDSRLSCGKKYVTREVEIFYSESMDIAMYHPKFPNIQTLIRVHKTLYDPKSKEKTHYTEVFIANFKTTAEDFFTKILSHWRVETYHYHLDMLLDEDDHIAYKAPFSIAILRSFALNLMQLFHNANIDEKLPTGKVTMAEIKRTCKHDDYFTAGLFEQEYAD